MALVNFPQYQSFKVSEPVGFVVHVEINRADKLNAFSRHMWVELQDIFQRLSPNPDVRCILLSGSGDRAFTTGLDVEDAANPNNPLSSKTIKDPSRKATSLRRLVLDLQASISAVANCEKPVVALIHGYAFGLAIDLSTACDVRFCTADAKFSVKEVDIGSVADVGTLTRLPRVAGGLTSWVKEVSLSARIFGADEAKQNHLVSRVVTGGKADLIQAGVEFASLIATKSPVAVQGTKHLLDTSLDRTVQDHLSYTAVWNSVMAQSTDMERAILSGLKKKKPTFEKL